MSLSSDLTTKKITTFPGINDQPRIPTTTEAGNGSHLIKQFNDLIDLLSANELIASNTLVDSLIGLLDSTNEVDVSKTTSNKLLIKNKKTAIYSLLKLIISSALNNALSLSTDDVAEKIDISLDLDNLFTLVSAYFVNGTGTTLTKVVGSKTIAVNSASVDTATIYTLLKTIILAGANSTITPNDTNKTLTVASTASGGGNSIPSETMFFLSGKGTSSLEVIKDDLSQKLKRRLRPPTVTTLNPPFGVGTQSIFFNFNSSLQYENEFLPKKTDISSVEFFIRLDTKTFTGSILTFSRDYDSGTNGDKYTRRLTFNNGNLLFQLNEIETANSTIIAQTTNAPIAAATWYYCQIGMTGGKITIRLNTAEVAFADVSGITNLDSTVFTIGAYNPAQTDGFAGRIANLRLTMGVNKFQTVVPTTYFVG